MKKSTARKVPRDQPNRKRAKAPRVAKEKAPSTFPGVVGIGASAGGLDAFSRLLHNLERDTGLAYVLVQHLSPEHESSLPELLGRAATIPVTQAQDGMVMEADHVYVIPPAKTMTVTDGHIRLVRRPKGRGLHLPIDTFLQSLAEVHGAGAIGVILSGAGSDGSRGVVAIKQAGGITFAQDSASAKHPNMPEAAVDTDSVDFVLTPEEIAVQLGKIGKYFAQTGEHPALPDETTADDKEIGAILKLLLRRTGVDFSQYRRGTVRRRILRRMLVNRLEKRSDYLASLTSNSGELELLYNDLLIGVTSFFRDPQVFDELRALVFPSIVESRTNGDPLRIWVAGCSGGEESYSIAIALFEFLEENGLEMPVQMFGTDLSDVAIARARAGLYPESIAEQVSPERLRRFFIPDRGGYRIAKFVRDVCIFSRQNIARDPPFSRLDLVSCRNVLIYFEQGLQRKIFPTFHYALKPHGMLLLGTAESPGAASDLFEPISKRHKIYRRRERSHDFRDLDFVNYTPSGPVATTSSSQKRAVPLRST
ncbi:MAG TPA: chemotaxis protein CheB, partial [Gemmatimonadaceae bacterium]|nr:chemotaxis protein CheB [Gemmatimonadaceae bacterium]